MKTPSQMHKQRLIDKNIVIEDIYQNGERIFTRTTDGIKNDSVYKGHRLKKNFYYNGKKIFCEKNFDKEVTYTLTSAKGEDLFSCSECGYTAPRKEFFDGCPYCGASFQIISGFKKKYDSIQFKEVISSKFFKLLIVIEMALIYFYWFKTSTDQELSLQILHFIALSPVVLFICYLGSSLLILILLPFLLFRYAHHKDIRIDRLTYNGYIINNQKIVQDLNHQLLTYYYDMDFYPDKKDLIDFEILDYNTYKMITHNNQLAFMIDFKIREYFVKKKHVKRVTHNEKVILIQNPYYVPKFIPNSAKKCHNCGANVELFDKKCSHCGSFLPSNDLWILDIASKK